MVSGATGFRAIGRGVKRVGVGDRRGQFKAFSGGGAVGTAALSLRSYGSLSGRPAWHIRLEGDFGQHPGVELEAFNACWRQNLG